MNLVNMTSGGYEGFCEKTLDNQGVSRQPVCPGPTSVVSIHMAYEGTIGTHEHECQRTVFKCLTP